jgi:hypothetical protein
VPELTSKRGDIGSAKDKKRLQLADDARVWCEAYPRKPGPISGLLDVFSPWPGARRFVASTVLERRSHAYLGRIVPNLAATGGDSAVVARHGRSLGPDRSNLCFSIWIARKPSGCRMCDIVLPGFAKSEFSCCPCCRPRGLVARRVFLAGLLHWLSGVARPEGPVDARRAKPSSSAGCHSVLGAAFCPGIHLLLARAQQALAACVTRESDRRRLRH